MSLEPIIEERDESEKLAAFVAREASLARMARWSVLVGVAAIAFSAVWLLGFTATILNPLMNQPIPGLSQNAISWTWVLAAAAGFVAVGLAKSAMNPENRLDRSLDVAGYIMGILALCATAMILVYLVVMYSYLVVRGLKRGGADVTRADHRGT